MPKISQQKRDKITEQILHYLFSQSPEAKFTIDIAKEIARDEEFVKTLLISLQKRKLVILIDKNKSGKIYTKRQRWRLPNEVYTAYVRQQANKELPKTQKNEE